MSSIQKYLETYAEPEIRSILEIPSQVWDDAIVIPARNEVDHLFETLGSVERAAKLSGKKILVILVVNGQASDAEENQKVLQKFVGQKFSAGVFISKSPHLDFLVIDRASAHHHFGEKEGVGLARKIGCDIALALFNQKKIISPWIRNTDADVLLPEDYFLDLTMNSDEPPAGFAYDFIHNSAPLGDIAPALDLYDLSLRYYVAALKWAGSPYAFHTVGSTLVVHAEAYAEVRGFPKKEAGEDFYILNKLAKIGKIEDSLGSPIQIQGRLSARTPFGTGPMISDFAKLLREEKKICFYHPDIFFYLKDWLELLRAFAHSSGSFREQIEANSSGKFLLPLLESLDAIESIQKLHGKAKTPERRLKHFHTWFDAFRTLKFVHGLRDSSLPSIPWQEAVDQLSLLTPDASLRYTGLNQQRSVVN